MVPSVPLIPAAVVQLNRWTIVATTIFALVLQAPLITTVLFAVILLAACFGRRASLIYLIGTAAFPAAADPSTREDPGLMRFNNSLAAGMLGLAQVAFLAHLALVGWILCAMTALAAAVALAGFCVGCFLFYQLKRNQARLPR